MSQVLIIEDDKDIRELISIHVSDLVCRIIECSNGESGLKLATGGPFDIIILDIMLPAMAVICLQHSRYPAKISARRQIVLLSPSKKSVELIGITAKAAGSMGQPLKYEHVSRVSHWSNFQSFFELSYYYMPRC